MSPISPAGPVERLREAFDGGPPLLLDAATGTELTRRGADTSAPLWSARAIAEAPRLLLAVHEDDAAAGAEILTAATFRTHRRNLKKAGFGEAAEAWTARAIALAREGGERGRARASGALRERAVFVAGSLAPLEECYRPELVPDDEALSREHAEQAGLLAAAGADLILVETMNTVRELLAAARAAIATGLPVVASAVTDGQGRLLSGEPVEEAAHALLSLPSPPSALGLNCVPARRLGHDLERLAAAAPGVPLAAWGNTGRPLDASGTRFTDPIEAGEYAALAASWIALGARVVGGCCGTQAGHTRALARMLGFGG